jgi:prepilin-type N-terminal cleavage/methylation domain-containing protein
MSYSAPATADGFTLIESLISVALLAILMGIALPSLEPVSYTHLRAHETN